mmetsp:Transcript_69229/g.150659  ORF Transcript_69229/g.150659 Transcript_69229/m.150659 type:complete len:206 (-) Transcript_69229:198-815(-)
MGIWQEGHVFELRCTRLSDSFSLCPCATITSYLRRWKRLQVMEPWSRRQRGQKRKLAVHSGQVQPQDEVCPSSTQPPPGHLGHQTKAALRRERCKAVSQQRAQCCGLTSLATLPASSTTSQWQHLMTAASLSICDSTHAMKQPLQQSCLGSTEHRCGRKRSSGCFSSVQIKQTNGPPGHETSSAGSSVAEDAAASRGGGEVVKAV